MSAIGDFFNKILSVFSTFGISDALDILFVAVIIYGCIRIIRETRAMQLAKGILLLLVMYGIVNLLHMEASSFIFKSIFLIFCCWRLFYSARSCGIFWSRWVKAPPVRA